MVPVGCCIGQYVVASLLGVGGTSEVYLVQRDGESFALKLLKEAHRQSTALQARLVNEAIVLRKLAVEGVVRVFDEGDFAGRPYYVMEYLPAALSSRLMVRLRPSEIVPVITRLLQIVAELHALGYVHRDVKPSNLLFAPDGSLRLADFGHAKLPPLESSVIPHSTETGAFLGTREYAAPEQLVNAKEVDGKADVYALGIILYEALAGERPFQHHRPEDLVRLRLTERAPPLSAVRSDLSPLLVSIVAQMLERSPSKRPSASVLVQRLATVPLVYLPRASWGRYAVLLFLPSFLSVSAGSFSRSDRFEPFGTALDEGSLDQARELLQQTKQQATTAELAAKVFQKEADLQRELGQLQEARRLYAQAHQRFVRLAVRSSEASSAIRLADTLLHLGEIDAAQDLYEQAMEEQSVAPSHPQKASAKPSPVHIALYHKGLYFIARQQWERAHQTLRRAANAAQKEPLWLARTEERLASLPTEPDPLPLLRSAIEHAEQALATSKASRRAQLALLRARHRHALLTGNATVMEEVYASLSALWSQDKQRGLLAHDYLELLMEGIAAFPARIDWKTQARSVMVELEARAQWQQDVHVMAWKAKLGA
jgi:serine/threonine protein kinase